MNGEGKGPDETAVMEGGREKLVFMMGYLPGALPQRSPLLSPIAVRSPASIHWWRDVCGGGCGFAMAISGAFFDLPILILKDCGFWAFRTELALIRSMQLEMVTKVYIGCSRLRLFVEEMWEKIRKGEFGSYVYTALVP